MCIVSSTDVVMKLLSKYNPVFTLNGTEYVFLSLSLNVQLLSKITDINVSPLPNIASLRWSNDS